MILSEQPFLKYQKYTNDIVQMGRTWFYYITLIRNFLKV